MPITLMGRMKRTGRSNGACGIRSECFEMVVELECRRLGLRCPNLMPLMAARLVVAVFLVRVRDMLDHQCNRKRPLLGRSLTTPLRMEDILDLACRIRHPGEVQVSPFSQYEDEFIADLYIGTPNESISSTPPRTREVYWDPVRDA